jgi:peptidoglycan/xylan/chitin deacetylase (PgdA/CDA1 family)
MGKVSAPARAISGIYALHGAAPLVDRERFEFQNISDAAGLRAFLSSAPRFAPLEEALTGQGAALTIDDGTCAAAEAARIAREYGHAVSIFVNPEAVESGEPYWFALLHLLLDRLDRTLSYGFEGVRYRTSTRAERRALREPIKARCRRLRREPDRAAFIMELAERWRALPLDVPSHLVTLRKADLESLRDAGVSLQNHGWSHTDHGAMAPSESAREIRDGRDWLRRELQVETTLFAVPFGDVRPSREGAAACDAWLTLCDRWPPGPIGRGAVNRVELRLSSEPGDWRQLLGSRLRHWRFRATSLFTR